MSTNIEKTQMPKVLYSLDESGTNEDNFIKGELHTVNAHADRDVKFIVPKFAPFFAKDFKVFLISNTNNNRRVELVEGVDYKLVLMYRGASIRLGTQIYGGISFENLCLDGVIELEYRTLGGNQVLDTQKVLKDIIEYNHNPRILDWEYVSNTPCSYNPLEHNLNLEDIVGMDELVAVLHLIANTIALGNTELVTRIDTFLESFDFCKFQQLVEALEKHSFLQLIEKIRELESSIDELKAIFMYDKYLELLEALSKYPLDELIARQDALEKEFEELKRLLDIDEIKALVEPLAERMEIVERKVKELETKTENHETILTRHDKDIEELKVKVGNIGESAGRDIEYLMRVVNALTDSYCEMMSGYEGLPVTIIDIKKGIKSALYAEATSNALSDGFSTFMDEYEGPPVRLKDILADIEELKKRK